MVFGSKLRLPVDIVIRLPETLPTVEATSTYVLNLVQNRGEVHHSACLKDDVVHQVQKDSFDRNVEGDCSGVFSWRYYVAVRYGCTAWIWSEKFHLPWKVHIKSSQTSILCVL